LCQDNGSIVENFFEEKVLIFEKKFDKKNENFDFFSNFLDQIWSIFFINFHQN